MTRANWTSATAWPDRPPPFHPWKLFFKAYPTKSLSLPLYPTIFSLYPPGLSHSLSASDLGFKIAYTPLGITLALTFVTLPFVVRTVQPVLADIPKEVEEAAACLGARPLQVFRHILVPALLPAWLTGFALAFARGVGEYGSVIFIAGNMPMKTEILPLLIMVKLDQYDYTGATAIGVLMLVVSFILLLLINLLQRRIETP